jgi:hypothetical protein
MGCTDVAAKPSSAICSALRSGWWIFRKLLGGRGEAWCCRFYFTVHVDVVPLHFSAQFQYTIVFNSIWRTGWLFFTTLQLCFGLLGLKISIMSCIHLVV